MENNRILKLFIVAVLVIVPQATVGAYSVDTHKELSKNVVTEYVRLTGKTLTDAEVNCIIQGSDEEDEDPRYLNHFFDPINNKGLDDRVPGTKARSVDWATNPYLQGNFTNWVNNKQTKLLEYDNDYSWQRAVYEYAHGNTVEGACALGHVLHLLEDKTSVPHTRDDAHGPTVLLGRSSYYEEYTANKIPNVRVSVIKKLSSLEQAFKDTATYTNTNFLSRDTIFEYYPNPSSSLLQNNIEGRFVLNNLGVKLLFVDYDIDKFGNRTIRGTELNHPQVLSAYWQNLSTRTVNDGVALLDLFFREVANEQRTGALAAMNKSYIETERIVNALADERDSTIGRLTSLAAADVYELNQKDIDGAFAAAAVYGIAVPAVARTSPLKDSQQNNNPASALLALQSATQQPQNADSQNTQTLQNVPTEIEIVSVPQEELPEQTPILQQPEPLPELIPAPAPIPQQQTQSIQTPGGIQPLTFGGGGVGGGGGSASSATTIETTEESNPEPEPERKPAPEPVDTTPPELTLTIAECAHSVSNSACVLTVASDLTINWEAVADDLDYVTYQGVETTDTTATDAIAANESKTFTVQAFDTAGNSTTKSITVYANTMPVVINEVAWSGTKASALDEWIELYNNSPYAITLDGWRVVVANGAFEIPLAGSIPSDAYFLIKKKQETDTNEETSSAILNVLADVWQPWDGGLSDRGVVLALTDSTDTVVDEVALCASNRWCAGATGGSSMERIRASEVNDTVNWSTADSTILFALDRSVTSMRGTPRARNIATGMLPTTIATDTTLTAAGSPYFVSGTSTIQPGATLTIHEGAVIKFMNSASQLAVKGALASEGSAENSVVFTALADDTYGGDSNYNDDSTTPNPGAWHSIQIQNGGVATLNNTLVRYGGRRSSGQSHHGAFDVQSGGTLTAAALTLEHAQEEALYIREGAMVTVQDSVFQHNEDASFGYGIYAGLGTNDASTIANSTFTNNAQAGVYAGGLGAYTITNNTFTQNGTALFVQNFLGDVLNNSGNNNTINGITLPATLGIVGTPQTLPANSLPYRITTTTTIPAGAEVTFGAGARVEFSVGGSSQLLVDGGALTLENGATLTSVLEVPTLGAWGSVVIKNGGTLRGSGATIEYAGGNSFYGEGGAGVYITDTTSTLTLSNSTIQHNKSSGVFAADGIVDISNTTIAHHTDGVGIDVRGGTVTLTNIIFDDNLENTNPVDLIP